MKLLLKRSPLTSWLMCLRDSSNFASCSTSTSLDSSFLFLNWVPLLVGVLLFLPLCSLLCGLFSFCPFLHMIPNFLSFVFSSHIKHFSWMLLHFQDWLLPMGPSDSHIHISSANLPSAPDPSFLWTGHVYLYIPTGPSIPFLKWTMSPANYFSSVILITTHTSPQLETSELS